MNVEHIIMVIKLDIVINNIMVKVVYFGKHISDKIRDVNRVFSEILISPFIVRNERKIRHKTYDEFVDIKKRVIISFDTDKQGDFVTKDVLNYVNSNSIDDRTFEFIKTYNAIYRNAFTVINVYGHVILDKSINYGKQ